MSGTFLPSQLGKGVGKVVLLAFKGILEYSLALQCQYSPTARNYLAENVTSDATENPCPKLLQTERRQRILFRK